MSERGSFVTEYIYCGKCFEAAKEILIDREKFLCSQVLPSWIGGGDMLPIIAGKIGGCFKGEELQSFDSEYNELLSEKICHNMRIAVLADVGEQIFIVKPKSRERES